MKIGMSDLLYALFTHARTNHSLIRVAFSATTVRNTILPSSSVLSHNANGTVTDSDGNTICSNTRKECTAEYILRW
jgi:hypothetical protein